MKAIIRRGNIILLLGLFLLLFSHNVWAAETISLNKNSVTIVEGKTVILKAKVTGKSKTVTWSTSNYFVDSCHVETVCCLYHQKKDFISVPYEPKDAEYLRQNK